MAKRFKKLSHTIYECKYHIVICPKYRYKIFKGEIAEYVWQQIYSLCQQKDLVEVLELNVLPEHIHLVMSIPPKYAVSTIMGYVKGKLSLRLFQRYEKILGTASMVTRVLRKYSWIKRRTNPHIREMAE